MHIALCISYAYNYTVNCAMSRAFDAKCSMHLVDILEEECALSDLADNVKVLLWQNKEDFSSKSYPEYIDFVAKQCGMTPAHFRDILRDEAEASDQDEKRIRDFFSDYNDRLSAIRYEFLFRDFIKQSADDILAENLRYLLKTIEYGENAEFVEAIGINPSTLSRWKQGKTKPDKYAQKQIAQFFGLNDSEVLRTELLFLDLEPVSTQQKKQACKKMIDDMDRKSFDAIYAALKKVLK